MKIEMPLLLSWILWNGLNRVQKTFLGRCKSDTYSLFYCWKAQFIEITHFSYDLETMSVVHHPVSVMFLNSVMESQAR